MVRIEAVPGLEVREELPAMEEDLHAGHTDAAQAVDHDRPRLAVVLLIAEAEDRPTPGSSSC
jgi:hypothetical protein